MDINPYDDTAINWLPQSPTNTNRSAPLSSRQQAQMRVQTLPPKAAPKQVRMPKQKALELVNALKKGIAVTSILGFGAFAWLAAGHVVGGTTTSQTTSNSTSNSTTTPSNSSSSSSTQSSSDDSSSAPSGSDDSSSTQSGSSNSSSTQSSGGFFNQGGGSSVGSSNSSNGVSGSSVS